MTAIEINNLKYSYYVRKNTAVKQDSSDRDPFSDSASNKTERAGSAQPADAADHPKKADGSLKGFPLRGVDLSIEEGEFVAILGKNGSGKSTLAKLLNGLLQPTSGEVKIFGLSTSEEKNLFEIRKNLGIVFQNPDNQMVATIIEDDIAFGPENIGLPPEEIGRRIDFALSAVDMQDRRRDTASRLSGGQKQRVAIAGILALRPKIIVFDESTAMLDPVGRREVMKVISELHNEGKTVLLITHYMEEAAQSSRVVVLNDGVIAMDGKPNEIFCRAEELEKAGLGVPVASKLRDYLKKAGFDMPEGITDIGALAEAICRLKR